MIGINLLPPELKLKRINDKKRASLIGISIVIVFVFIIIGVVGLAFKENIKANLNTTKSNLEQDNILANEDKKIQELALLINDRWQATQSVDEERVLWSQVLQELNNSAPFDVQFENINAQVGETPNFILQGNTTTEREIIKFNEKLENSIFFNNVSFKSSSLTKNEDESEKLNFTLEFDLERRQIDASTPTDGESPTIKEIK